MLFIEQEFQLVTKHEKLVKLTTDQELKIKTIIILYS